MTNINEAADHAAADQSAKDMAKKRAEAKPDMSLLHHINATQAMTTGFTVMLLDGSSHKATRGDFIFTDGLSIMQQDGRRIYFPLNAIRSILIHKPDDK